MSKKLKRGVASQASFENRVASEKGEFITSDEVLASKEPLIFDENKVPKIIWNTDSIRHLRKSDLKAYTKARNDLNTKVYGNIQVRKENGLILTYLGHKAALRKLTKFAKSLNESTMFDNRDSIFYGKFQEACEFKKFKSSRLLEPYKKTYKITPENVDDINTFVDNIASSAVAFNSMAKAIYLNYENESTAKGMTGLKDVRVGSSMHYLLNHKVVGNLIMNKMTELRENLLEYYMEQAKDVLDNLFSIALDAKESEKVAVKDQIAATNLCMKYLGLFELQNKQIAERLNDEARSILQVQFIKSLEEVNKPTTIIDVKQPLQEQSKGNLDND